MNRKVLIHAPNLDTPGGKQTYFKSIRPYLHSEASFFFYGAQGKKEGVFAFIRRVLKDYWLFYRTLKRGNFDLVHLNPSLNFLSFFRDSIFALICQFFPVKTLVFWRGWNVDFEKKVVRKILPFFRLTYGRADAMILLGTEFMDRISAYGYHRPLYLTTTVVNEQIINAYQHSEEYRPGHSGVTILFLARVERAKGIYELIDSVQHLLPDYPDLMLKIAGVGAELEPARKYVAEKSMTQIDFLGWITGEEKSRALSDADIYVLASSHGEGMPNALLEAMASGLAVISTDVGGIKDFFQDGQMGYVVQPHDTPDLIEKIEKLLSAPEQIARFGAYNASYARRHFSPQIVTQKLEKIYEETIAGPNSGT